MSSKIFKRTAIAASLLAVSQAHAALYRVVQVSPEVTSATSYSYGDAIQPGDNGYALGCFDSSATCGDGSSYEMAYDTNLYTPGGVGYREEVPFGVDNQFQYIGSESDFESYCNTYLGYSYCDGWANYQYNPWENEQNSTVNVSAYVAVDNINTPTPTSYTSSTGNTVINSLYGAVPATPTAVGNQSTFSDGLNYRNKAFSENSTTTDNAISSYDQSRAFFSDGTYTVGSVSTVDTANNSNNHLLSYYSQPAIWDPSASGTEIKVFDFQDGGSSYKDSMFGQGSIRGFVTDGSALYAVGYDTYTSSQYMQATIFSTTDYVTNGIDGATWTVTPVTNATVLDDGSRVYWRTVVTAINKNLVAIGNAKRSVAQNQAYPNRMFVIPDVSSSPTATYLSTGIFANSVGGSANAINSSNEIVGQVDAESNQEIDGKARRLRGFIDPYSGTGTDTDRRKIFNNQAWLLDDLTNGDNGNGNNYSTANNAYRIIDATGINDDGVISATAIKCLESGGYDDDGEFATCGGGSGVEVTVAVKLVPIPGASYANNNIDPRATTYPKTERKGGSVGWLGLSLLTLLGLQRRRRT